MQFLKKNLYTENTNDLKFTILTSLCFRTNVKGKLGLWSGGVSRDKSEGNLLRLIYCEVCYR